MAERLVGREYARNHSVKYAILAFLGVTMAVVHIYVLWLSPLDPIYLRTLHLQFIICIGLLVYGQGGKLRSLINIILILLSFSAPFIIISDTDDFLFRAGVMPSNEDLIVGSLTIFIILEITRRSVGNTLVILALIFMGYCLWGNYLPEIIASKGYPLERMISFMFSMHGIYSIPLGTCATYVYVFVLFGAFLAFAKTTDLFMDLSFSLAGARRGGPAKVAVLCSALFGMVNGTSVGNVVTTGTLTIPLMKRVGYRPEVAAGVEATASTGGQILPPVMGAAVFLMITIIDRAYADIIVAAAIPGVLYYVAVMLTTDFEAIKYGLAGLPKKEIPPMRDSVRKLWLGLPMLVLLYFLVIEMKSVIYAGLSSMLCATIIAIILRIRKQAPWDIYEILDGFISSGKSIVQVAATCATAGIVIGSLTLTGLGIKLSSAVMELADGSLIIGLILSMLVTIVLGMGLPTIAAYAITASVVAPTLISMGIPVLPAHLFILYYASLSAITPPVALAAYAGAAIAGCNPKDAALQSMKFGMAGFLIPFFFVYNPALLLMGTRYEIILATVCCTWAVFWLAAGFSGFLFCRLTLISRSLLLAGSVSLITINPIAMGANLVLFALILLCSRFTLLKGVIYMDWTPPARPEVFAA